MILVSNMQAEKARHDVALICTLKITQCLESFSQNVLRQGV